jgi:tRNA pseudouridine55 synthase
VTLTDGVLVLDKPAGVSSAKALGPVKREAGKGLKVGHAGTLDPFATGVLLVLLGDATRLSDLAMALPKTYRATVRFGVSTDTLDPEGEVTEERDSGPPRDLPLARFVGEIEQVPPAFSALKVDGRRAYKLARAGRPPELKARPVTVHRLDIVGGAWPDVELEVVCGAGTYIRALARDLGAAVDLPAHLTALRRTRIGPFAAGEAGRVHPPLDLVRAAGIAVVEVSEADALALAQGRTVEHDAAGRVAFAVDGAMVGLADGEGGQLFPATVLSHARARLEGR